MDNLTKVLEPYVVSILVILASGWVMWNNHKQRQRQVQTDTTCDGSEKANSFTNKNVTEDKPFESSYYYAHNSSRQTGGYTDGLAGDDYVMNGPRRLNETETKKILEKKQQQKAMLRKDGLEIQQYSWEDDMVAGVIKIRIESLPMKGTDRTKRLPWSEANIVKSNISYEVTNKGSGFFVEMKNAEDGAFYYLDLPQLFAPVTEVSIIWKVKRLIIKFNKEDKYKGWTDLKDTSLVAAIKGPNNKGIEPVDEFVFKNTDTTEIDTSIQNGPLNL